MKELTTLSQETDQEKRRRFLPLLRPQPFTAVDYCTAVIIFIVLSLYLYSVQRASSADAPIRCYNTPILVVEPVWLWQETTLYLYFGVLLYCLLTTAVFLHSLVYSCIHISLFFTHPEAMRRTNIRERTKFECDSTSDILMCLVFWNSKTPHVYVCSMCSHHIYSKGEDQPGKVASPARGQLNRENDFLPVPVRA